MPGKRIRSDFISPNAGDETQGFTNAGKWLNSELYTQRGLVYSSTLGSIRKRSDDLGGKSGP